MPARITKFGVELEICWDIGPEGCLAPEVHLSAPVTHVLFKEKFEAYFRSILLNSRNLEFFRETYRYVACIDDLEDTFIYDLRNPGAEPVDASTNAEFKDLVTSYKIPIFMDDITVECGEIIKKLRKYPVKSERSFRLECVTPILSIEGEVTEAKVEAALMPHLRFFGLDREECFFANGSAGFHVNVSLWNPGADRAIDLSSKLFRKKFLNRYAHYENKEYGKVRTRLPAGKKEANWARRLAEEYRRLERLGQDGEEIQENMNTFLKLGKKPYAVKVKPESVFEFRLYQSEADAKKLCDYTFAAMHLLNSIYDEAVAKKLIGGSRRRGRHAPSLRLRNAQTRRRK